MARLRDLIGSKHAVAVICLVLILAFGGILVQSSYRAGQQILTNGVAASESVARSAEIATDRSLLATESLLWSASEALASTYRDMALDGPEVSALLQQLRQQSPLARDIVILDAGGRELNGSVQRSAQWDLGERSLAESGQAGILRRDPVDGAWSLLLARKLTRDGEGWPVVAAVIPVARLGDTLAATGRVEGMRVALLSSDGTLIAAAPTEEQDIGRRGALAAAVVARQAGSRAAASFEAALPKGESIVSYRAMSGRPMIVTVALAKSGMLQAWRSERRKLLALFVIFAFCASWLSWSFARILERRQIHLEALHRNETTLQQQSGLLQSTLEHMGEGLSVFDRGNRLLAWNDRFISLLRLPPGIGIGTRLEDILRLQARRGDFGRIDIETEIRRRLDSMRQGDTQTTEQTAPNGRVLEIRRRRMPYGGVVMLYSDITERKQAERQMIGARNQAEIANRSKSEFLANMSHELRTPLNAIIGFSDIIQNEKFGTIGNAKYSEYVRDIHNSGLHLLDLINDVLDMSKIEAGKMELFEEEVVVDDLVAACLTMVRERARGRRVRIAADLSPQSILLFADQRAMKQILLNLLSNAVKFSREGGAVTLTARLDAVGGVLIQVADSGIGMTPEQIERARQPFGQAHASTTSTYGGTGLGLPITQRLVELHGGELFIDSTPDIGTTASIVLPPSRTRDASRKRA